MLSAFAYVRALARCAAVAALLMAAGCGSPGNESGHVAPTVEKGALDLSSWDWRRDGMVALDGDWEFLPDTFANTKSAGPASYLRVPGPWNDAQAEGGQPMGGEGFGTYRLTILCGQVRDLALALPMQHSALRLYVNGKEAASQGVPGTSEALSRPAPVQQIVHLDDQACPLRVVAHVSNYDIRRGGLVRSITLGTREQVHERRERNLARDLFSAGALMVMGLLPIAFFMMRRRDTAPLYFGLYCLTFALVIGLIGERALQPVVAPLGWNAYLRIAFASMCLTQVLYALFLAGHFPRLFPRALLGVILGGGLGAAALVLVTPASVFSEGVGAIQAGAVLVAISLTGVLLRGVFQRRAGAALMLVGLLALIASVVHDALYFDHLQQFALAPWGVLACVAMPTLQLARRFSRALSAEELRHVEQRERADLVVRSTKAGVMDWDVISGAIKYSDRYLEMLGYPPGTPQASLRQFYDMVHTEDRERVRNVFTARQRDRSVRNGVSAFEPLDYRLRCIGGEWLWVHAEGIGLCGPDGRTLRFICSFIDISATKQHEAEILASEQALAMERERLRLLVRSTKAGFGDWNARTDVVTYSERFKEMLGYPPDADTSAWPSIFEMMHPDDRQRAQAGFRAMIRRKSAPGEQEPGEPMSYRLRRVDGSYIWIHAEGIAQVDEDGRTTRFITSYLDVTTFREQEEALRRSQKRLELVLGAARVGIVDWDGVTHATYYSPRFREIRGYAPDADTSGWPDYFKVMIHPDDRGWVTKRWVPFIQGKGPEGKFGEFYAPEEYRMLRADGSYAWVLVSGMAVRDSNGFVVRWIAAVIDTTERRAQEEALKENVRLREEVERIGRHDIKTPLNSIIAVPRLLREERELSADEDDLLGIVERAGYRILSMVNLSLDLYKMENGSYIFRPDAVNLADLTGKVITDLRSHAASKHVSLDVVQDRAAPAFAWAEELLCYSLIANLLKNAVEASPEGAIVTVTLARKRGEDGMPDSVLMDIHNMGAVPLAVRGNFFQKYATAGKASGTGLGAYSAQLMARVQDGTIAMRTSDEDGTTITVRLKAAPAGTVPVTERHVGERIRGAVRQLAQLPPLNVLLVDDDEYNLLIVRRYLPTPPLTVQTAINGRTGLEAAQKNWPDVIFMDLDMPVMGGMEAVGLLREHERTAGCRRCRMIALSSHDDAATQTAALDAGFDQYLTKPVTRQAVYAALAHFGAVSYLPDDAADGATDEVSPGIDGARDVVIDPDMRSMIGGFVESRVALLDGLERAITAGDRAELRRIAHQLSGSFALYGFNWAAAESRILETTAGDVDLAQARELVQAFREHLGKVVASVG